MTDIRDDERVIAPRAWTDATRGTCPEWCDWNRQARSLKECRMTGCDRFQDALALAQAIREMKEG